MSKPIIEVSNLSKSYTITQEGSERYTALRDVMAQRSRNVSVMLIPIAIGRSISSKSLNTPCRTQ